MSPIDRDQLARFLTESNAIEGEGPPTEVQIAASEEFLRKDELTISDVIDANRALAAHASLRERIGMDVRVGRYLPPPGGPLMRSELIAVLADMHTARSPRWEHKEFEQLHPFTDGNGRVGRLLWLWMKMREDSNIWNRMSRLAYPFLQLWYYDDLGDA